MPFKTKKSVRAKNQLGSDGKFETAVEAAELKFPIENELLEYRNSSLHGIGVFAKRFIPRNSRICEYKGDLINKIELDKRQSYYESIHRYIRSTYVFKLSNNRYIDATKTGNEARFINHSCNADCIAVKSGVNNVVINAKHSIQAGEELTLFYDLTSDHPGEPRTTCHCKSKNCAGFL